MKETEIRQEVYRMLHKDFALWPITQTDASICPRCHNVIKPPGGRPDIMVLNPWGQSIVVEVKAIRGGSFAFSQIEEKQRKWLNRWEESDGRGFIAIGTLERPRRLWIIDWFPWLRLEEVISEHQASIPVTAGPGYLRSLQDNNLDMDNLCKDFELNRITGGWEMPKDHTIRRMYEFYRSDRP